MENMWRALEKVRNLLLRILNKQFLIFLFFLILSSVFWLIMTLNETYEKEMTIPLRLAGVPRKVVIPTSLTVWSASPCATRVI